ncbi:hypothetical protein FY528_15180 [Hymenobacter lutimineralis]|uniref:Phosphatidic acid phosphatase type 2/haloperoxidase domain-containing protein n=1 Tax=Hymenobacter lutimineralis TaxID=2606448 RepID=A0A5D6UWM8_9BACT|nr:phosphatase PAP2 family protein [Hymenobacter lutimineralis]TYZ07405.1 hypothetical protein FY528_15180 [Hymenobacter lutimineralis]
MGVSFLLLYRVSAVVSFLGHPLVTTMVFAVLVARHHVPGSGSAWIIGSVALLVVGPISVWNLWQTRRGGYTNFDVSQRTQRHSFYPVLLVLLGAATAGLFWQQQGGAFRYGLLAVWALLLVCFALNFWLKVSLHAAISFFLACVVLTLYPGWGWLALVAAGLVAASRLVLRRHTASELLAGTLLGTIAGLLLAWEL